MGASTSRLEDDKALQLCRERKKFVRQALDGRCSLAAAHFTYIQSLRNIGTALGKFVEPEATFQSSLYTSTSATPRPLAITNKSLSNVSSSPSLSQHVDATETHSFTPSPLSSSRFQSNYMKTGVSSSTTVEERHFPSVRTLRSSASTPQNETPQSTERPHEDFQPPPETSRWDYFGLLHPIDRQFSFQEVNGSNHGFENANDITRLREEEGIPDLEEEKAFSIGEIESSDSEDEFEEPTTDSLVQKFENRGISDSYSSPPSTLPSSQNVASESNTVDGEKSNSFATPIREDSVTTPNPEKETTKNEPGSPSYVAPKDFLLSIKEIEHLFVRASDYGKEVPRMLEANKLHFRPMLPGKEGESTTSMFLKACFSCGDDPSQAPEEEPPATGVKYLTWHRTESSRSSSSRNFLGATSKDDIEDISSNIFESFCMNSGSHASTLDRLYAWERKLCDEVKDSTIIRKEYDMKCKLLRELESKVENPKRIGKTRANVKDLYSRIRVAIHRIDSISKRIEELRDKELQPQLEELIEGLRRMWEKMFECHRLQFNIIRVAYRNGSTKISFHSESHRQATIHLEYELKSFSSSFTKWIIAQKGYLESINGWLHKCVTLQQKTSRRNKKLQPQSLKNLGPPIYVTCGDWLEKLNTLPSKEVADSAKALAVMTTHFLPRQEKKHSNRALASDHGEVPISTPREGTVDDSVYDRFQESLRTFLNNMSSFSSASVDMYKEIKAAIDIEKAKEREKYNTLKTHA